MKIKAVQIAAFVQAENDAFAERLTCSLHARRAGAADPPRELSELVRAQIARAEAHGLQTEWQIAVYVTAAAALGVDFDTRIEAVREVLADRGAPLDRKARIILAHLDGAAAAAEGS